MSEYIELVASIDTALRWVIGSGHEIKPDILGEIMKLDWYRQAERGKPPVVELASVVAANLETYIAGGPGDAGRGLVGQDEKRWDKERFMFYTTRRKS